MRSWLFTPATRPERFGKAAVVGADVLILDLEDAVAAADKERARASAIEFLAAALDGRPQRALRINGLDTAHGIADLHALLGSAAAPDIVLLPKAESGAHLRILDRLLTAAGKSARLVALVESAAALAGLDAIATATPRLAGLMLGAADLAADLGAAVAWEPLLAARSALVAACARAGVVPIDTPFFDTADIDGLRAEVARSKALGLVAKAAIHPDQVGAINGAFTPTAAEVAPAREVLSVNRAGVGRVDGEMVDEAVARTARRVLAAAGP